MGVALTELLQGTETSLRDLRGKTFAVDAFNMLYQFLTTIRTPDGTPLRDRHGAVTSHLIGLFSRATTFMGEGLKLVFVFDGEAPELKRAERERRAALKREARAQYERAAAAHDVAAMKKYAGRTARLTPDMVAEAKELLRALGVPIVQAPGEGEAHAAQLCRAGMVYAVISQDADAFLFGAPRVVRNLSVSRKRKQAGTLTYERTTPLLLSLEENLRRLALTREQLIVLALLVGTDYNRAGIKGIGPKRALKLVREYGTDYDGLFAAVNWTDAYPELPWRTLLNAFLAAPHTEEVTLSWRRPDERALHQLLVAKHDFSPERIQSALKKLAKADSYAQRGLQEFCT